MTNPSPNDYDLLWHLNDYDSLWDLSCDPNTPSYILVDMVEKGAHSLYGNIRRHPNTPEYIKKYLQAGFYLAVIKYLQAGFYLDVTK